MRVHRTPRVGLGAGGWGTIAFGAVFLVVGFFMGLVPTGIVPIEAAPKAKIPPAMMLSIALVFGLSGLGIMASGVMTLRSRARSRRLVERSPNEPWLADGPWDPRFARSDSSRQIWQSLAMSLLIGLFLVPFHWIGIYEGITLFLIGAIVMDLVLIGLVYRTIYLTLQRLKYRQTQLQFRNFPTFLGESLDLDLVVGGRLAASPQIEFTLKCLRSKQVIEQVSSSQRRQRWVCEELWSRSTSVELDRDLATGDSIPIQFHLPHPGEAPGTQLMSESPTYWEIDIAAQTEGVDFAATYLIPIYAQP